MIAEEHCSIMWRPKEDRSALLFHFLDQLPVLRSHLVHYRVLGFAHHGCSGSVRPKNKPPPIAESLNSFFFPLLPLDYLLMYPPLLLLLLLIFKRRKKEERVKSFYYRGGWCFENRVSRGKEERDQLVSEPEHPTNPSTRPVPAHLRP